MRENEGTVKLFAIIVQTLLSVKMLTDRALILARRTWNTSFHENHKTKTATTALSSNTFSKSDACNCSLSFNSIHEELYCQGILSVRIVRNAEPSEGIVLFQRGYSVFWTEISPLEQQLDHQYLRDKVSPQKSCYFELDIL